MTTVHQASVEGGGQPAEFLRAVRGLVIDMDGVLWRGKEPVPGLTGFFDILRRFDIRFVLATNNPSRRPQEYAEKARQFGVLVRPEQVISSGTVMLNYLSRRYPPGTRIHVIGEPSLHGMVAEAGYVLAEDSVAVVVVSMDRRLTYDTLKVGTRLLREGADFIATNPDAAYPSDEGILPGSGTMMAALMASSGRTPTVMGKPEPYLFELALRRLDLPPSSVASLGDRLDTDVAAARAAGLHAILVLTGYTSMQEVPDSPIRPDLTCRDISELASLLGASRQERVPTDTVSVQGPGRALRAGRHPLEDAEGQPPRRG